MTLHHRLLPILLLAFAACGGGALNTSMTGTTAGALDASVARKATNDLVTLESAQGSDTALPIWVHSPDGQALSFNPGLAAGCITKDAPTSDVSGTHVLAHYACTGPQGGTLTGTVESIFSGGHYTLVYNLLATYGSNLTWEYTGTRVITLNSAAHTSSITAAITIVAKDNGTTLATETYGATWNADFATANTYKLWGSFTVNRSGQEPLMGSVAADKPLIWTSGCCYPTSGTLTLAQANKTALVVFTSTCGQLTLSLPGSSDATVFLPAC